MNPITKVEKKFINSLFDDIVNNVSKTPIERVIAIHKIEKINELFTNPNDPNMISNAETIFNDQTITEANFDGDERDLLNKLIENPNIPIDEIDETAPAAGGKRHKKLKHRSRRAHSRSAHSRRAHSLSAHSRRAHSRRAHSRSTRSMKYSITRIVSMMTEMGVIVKLHHWRTHSYSVHKATDNLHEALSEQVDSFVEKLLGSKNARANLVNMRMRSYNSLPLLKRRVEHYKQYLREMPASLGSDLLNIRDELLGSLNQFSYMLTLN